MEISEKELEDLIFESEGDKLANRGLFLHWRMFQQLRIGNYGIADIVSVNLDQCEDYGSYLNITIVELKKDTIDSSAFFQALRYAKGIKSYISKKNPKIKFKFNIVLIGKCLDQKSGFVYMPDLIDSTLLFNNGKIESVKLFTYQLSLDGLYFNEESGYKLTNEGFDIVTKFKKKDIVSMLDNQDLPF